MARFRLIKWLCLSALFAVAWLFSAPAWAQEMSGFCGEDGTTGIATPPVLIHDHVDLRTTPCDEKPNDVFLGGPRSPDAPPDSHASDIEPGVPALVLRVDSEPLPAGVLDADAVGSPRVGVRSDVERPPRA